MPIDLNPLYKKIIFLVALIICLSPYVNPPLALLFGFVLAITIGHPFVKLNRIAVNWLLKTSVVGLGFGMNLYQAMEAGKEGFVFTFFSIAITLLFGWLLSKWMKIDGKISYLISSGTAVCGGSAIAAVSPIIKADDKQMSVALGTVFVLNSVALIIFPSIGHWLNMTEHQFGLWCAVAIHDTSSVVGAATNYGQESLQVATTIKLERALWIIPLSLLTILFVKGEDKKINIPYFIGLFILAMCISTFLPEFKNQYSIFVAMAKKGLTVTLFLIGAGLSIQTIKSVGIKPMMFGASLWILISVISVSIILNACSQTGDQNKNGVTNSTKNIMVKAPGKKPMLLLTDRPYNLETPLKYFLKDFTPNDVFFIRWHLANLPIEINADTFRLRIGGNVKNELAISINDLKTKFKPYTINALCVCAGNARSCFNPQVAGAQWVNGGMGNAQWTGVKLKDILEMAGAKPTSKFVSFNGMDAPPLLGTPDFVKSLEYNHAINGEVMIAYEMNGEPIPLLNGFPLKLVVPGWYATYWIGMLNEVKVYADTFKGYWMNKAYLVPNGVVNGNEKPDSLSKVMTAISKIDVRSIFVFPEPNENLIVGTTYEIQGLAFDGGSGITNVEISSDSGKIWMETKLDASLGNYSWRRWRYNFKPILAGTYKFFVKAINADGETQPWHHWNRSGYMRNEIESLTLKVN